MFNLKQAPHLSEANQSNASGNIQAILANNTLHDSFLSERKALFLYFCCLIPPVTLKNLVTLKVTLPATKDA